MKRMRFYHATYGRPRQGNCDSRQPRHVGPGLRRDCPWSTKSPNDIDSIQPRNWKTALKNLSALTGGDEATYCALGIKINESLMASAFPDRAAVICAPRSSTVLAQFNDTLNYLAACHKCPDDSFGNRISVLQGSWFVITHMLGGETGSAHAPAVDLCHHVSSCFSFWGRHRLIRLSYSYNYFCPAPFLMPLPVSPSCSPSPGRAGASIPEDVTPHYLSPAMPHMGVGNYLRLNTIFQIKPRN